jgi:hypothetical protein
LLLTATTLPLASVDINAVRKSHFDCFLADQPSYLVPERLLATPGRLKNEPLVVNPFAWFSWRDAMPSSVAACYPLPDRFLCNAGLIWVDDPVTGMQTPFWAGPWFQEKLARLSRGKPALDLSVHHRSVLTTAGVLVTNEDASRKRAAFGDHTARLADTFRANDFVPLPGLIHPFHIGSLRRYYRYLVRSGGMTLGDSGSPRRFVVKNEPVARFFHRQLAKVVGVIAGIRVKPSYVYVSSYQSGAELPAHTDRIQCEYSITLLIDHTPEPFDRSPWPLYLETPWGSSAIWQGIGDSLLYRGRQLPHHRTRLADGMTSTSIFFHYVDHDFAGPLD